MEEQQIRFLESIEAHEDLGDIFWKAGNYVEAVSRYRCSDKSSASRKSVECLMEGLRSNITIGSGTSRANPVVTKLLSMTQELNLDQDQYKEVGRILSLACQSAG